MVLNIGLCSKSFAQTNTFDFSTTLGDGSFTLSLNNLTLDTVSNNFTTYSDPVDMLSFNGTNYDSLIFTVINNLPFIGSQYVDGFIIQGGSDSITNPPDLSIVALGNASIIDGNSASDLVKVLSNFDSFYSGSGVYPSPIIQFQQDSANPAQNGNLLSIELVSSPEPATTSLVALAAMSLFFWRRHPSHGLPSS